VVQQRLEKQRVVCLQKVTYINIEPKPAKCFSILGFKTIQGQRTFNIECDKEEDCINYVDFISILINSFKTMKDEVASNVDSKSSSLK
jgi:hypothetical protein